MITLWFYRGDDEGRVKPGTEAIFKMAMTSLISTLAQEKGCTVKRTPQIDNDDDNMNLYMFVYWLEAPQRTSQYDKSEEQIAIEIASTIQRAYPQYNFTMQNKTEIHEMHHFGISEYVYVKEMEQLDDSLRDYLTSFTARYDLGKDDQVVKYYGKKTTKRILRLAKHLGFTYNRKDKK